jgi:hypothetical protein
MRGIAACSAACSCVIVVGVAATAWSVNSASYEVVSPASIVSERFPDGLEYWKRVALGSVARTNIGESFDVLLSGGRALTVPLVQSAEYTRPYSLFDEIDPSTARPVTARASAATIATPVIAGKRPRQPRHAMFNDAQIASIKARLALDQDQEQHWPAVEAALRTIAWREAGSSSAQLEPSSVQRLAVASGMLIDRLRERQKQELRVFVRLMGLEKLASQL